MSPTVFAWFRSVFAVGALILFLLAFNDFVVANSIVL